MGGTIVNFGTDAGARVRSLTTTNGFSLLPSPRLGWRGWGFGFHWCRFKVPITVAAGAAAVVSVLGDFLRSLSAMLKASSDILSTSALFRRSAFFPVRHVLGKDSSDPRRETNRPDVAFTGQRCTADRPSGVHCWLTDGSASPVETSAFLILYVARLYCAGNRPEGVADVGSSLSNAALGSLFGLWHWN